MMTNPPCNRKISEMRRLGTQALLICFNGVYTPNNKREVTKGNTFAF